MKIEDPVTFGDTQRTDAQGKRDPVAFFARVLDSDGEGAPMVNVATLLTQEELDLIGQKVVRQYDIDKVSRSEWEETIRESMKIAKQTMEAKNTPWPGASNIKWPLITKAAIMFAARAYPALIQGREIVHCTIQGKDEKGAKQARALRVSEHMSWQLLQEMDAWEEDLDKLLHILPVVGVLWKKVYWDPVTKKNRSDLVTAEQLVVHYKALNMETVRRITQIHDVYRSEVYERVMAGVWLDVDLPLPTSDKVQEDEDAPYEILEQHRYLDLDGDGYEEPWVVVVHKATSKVLQVYPRFEEKGVHLEGSRVIRIDPIQYYVKYGFIPNPDGSIYDLGFGSLMFAINAAINAVVNQLLDAGKSSNMACGWIDKSVKEGAGVVSFQPGEWKKTDTKTDDLRNKIFPMPTKEPSQALFNLLQMLVEQGEDLGNVKDVLSGDMPAANTPATTVLAMIEQSLKQFSAIFKRQYRSLGKEFQKLFKLNSIYLEEETYFRLLDRPEEELKVLREDYNAEDLDVLPVADPNMVSDIQRMARAQVLLDSLSGRPNVNEDEITKRLAGALAVEDPEALIIPEEDRQQAPDPMVVIEEEKMKLERDKYELEVAKFASGLDEVAAKVAEIQAKTADLLASAESRELGPQLQMYLAQVKQLYDVAKERIRQGQALSKGKGGEGQAQPPEMPEQAATGEATARPEEMMEVPLNGSEQGNAGGMEALPGDTGSLPPLG